MKLRLGTRASALAMAQTNAVIAALRSVHGDLLDVEVVQVSTHGDRTQHTNLPGQGWGQGVFVKEIEQALLDETIDVAVHSMKDLPPEETEGLVIGAVPERADPTDVLVTLDGRSLESLPSGARVGTSSARRAAFLRAQRSDLTFSPIRGNVDTRYKKLVAGEYDAIVLAAAGLDRLGLSVTRVPLSTDQIPPAPGHGALAIQVRASDTSTQTLIAPLHHAPTAAAVTAERTAMRLLDGGCRLPVAALATPENGNASLRMLVAVASTDGSQVLRAEDIAPLSDAALLARRIADDLHQRGAAKLLSPEGIAV